jgi:DNA ligase D-like protein (predicted 3'-phosphoesterase)
MKYVIHEHHASHLHWDLRLEHKGVLKSWAIPKEPSDDPSVKRLALEVEDHDLDYAKFEGIIPEGEYGAGKVKIWDSGTFDAIEFTGSKVDMAIHGKKLNGHFHLIKFKKAGPKSWLFFKSKDHE